MMKATLHSALFSLLLILSQTVFSLPTEGDLAHKVTPELLNSKIKEAEANSGLDETTKANLIKLYRMAQTEIEAAKNFETSAGEFVKSQKSSLAEAASLRKKLAKPTAKTTLRLLDVAEGKPLTELSQTLLKEQAERSVLQANLAEIDAQLEQYIHRPEAIHQRLGDARRDQEEVSNALGATAAPNEPQILTEARNWSLQLRRKSLNAEIQALDQELLTQPLRLELLQLQRDMAARVLSTATERVGLLQNLIDKLRKAEAQQAEQEAAAAQQDAAGKHQLLSALAKKNATLTRETTADAAELENINRRIERYKNQYKQYETDYKGTKQKMEIAGLSATLGRVLMEQRRQLEDTRRLKRRNAKREKITATVGLRQIRHSDERKRLGDLDKAMEREFSGLPPMVRNELAVETRVLLQRRRGLLDKAIALDSNLLRRLVEADFAERQLIDLITSYDNFLAEHLLWIRSTDAVDSSTLKQLPLEIKSLLSPDNWIPVLKSIAVASLNTPWLLIGLPIFLLLLWNRSRLRRNIGDTGKCVDDFIRDRFRHTLKAMIYALLLALSWPLLIAIFGGLTDAGADGHPFVKEVSRYLLLIAPLLLVLRLFWILCEDDGIGEKHFRWPQRNTHLLRRQIYRLMVTLLPAAFFTMVSNLHALGYENMGLSRLAFVAMMLSLSYFLFRILSPRDGIIIQQLQTANSGFLSNTKYIWFPVAVGSPLVLALLAVLGYFYTASILTQSLVNSMLLILAVIVSYEITIRWLLVRLKQARRAVRDKMINERMEQTTSMEEGEIEGLPPVEEPQLDLEAIDAQTRKLLHTAVQLTLLIGLWIIWSSVLPAFAIFNDISLWQQTVTIGGEQQQLPITLADLALAVIIGIITAVAARTLPSVIEILLLQQLTVNPGTRYAYETLTRYLVVGIGIVAIFSLVGGSWSQIQWLVAALGVGIGFGLQEIVANFISGLIILFERPIRVGDIVTVEGTTGVVSKIRIRATTITNWDRQELLVPNKEFITNRLLNWSLSDSINRVTIVVGIAYGADVVKALQLLEEAATEHERVMDDPAPIITFDNFGDNSLNLKLRCYLPNIDHRLKTTSELHKAINDKFDAAGIVIAFPQRDIHLDTASPLEIRITKD